MSEMAKRLLQEAMKLSAEERSLLGMQLLESVAAANDDLDPEDRADLQARLAKARADVASGHTVDARDFMQQLAERRQ